VSSAHRKLQQLKKLKNSVPHFLRERDRLQKHWLQNKAPPLAQDHLIRVILVSQYGEPRIDEPLARACDRAWVKLGSDRRCTLDIPASRALITPLCGELEDSACHKYLDAVSQSEPPTDDVKLKISTWIRQTPPWLCSFCKTDLSMKWLGLDPPPRPKEEGPKLQPTGSDIDPWPWLPQGILIPTPDYLERLSEGISPEEERMYATIHEKPREQWTRREHRFAEKMLLRAIERVVSNGISS
jgi:hypothetical protein